MKNLVTVLFLFLAGIVSAQNISVLGLYRTIPVGIGDDKIEFRSDLSNWSPRTFDFIDGRRIWIAGKNNVKVYDSKERTLDKISVPQFRTVDIRGYIANAEEFAFSGAKFVANSGDNVLVYGEIDAATNSIKSYQNQDDIRVLSNFYSVETSFYFYDADGFVRCVKRDGSVLDNASTVKIIGDAFEKTWYSDRSLKDKHRDLLKTGKYLVSNGIFFPKDYWQLVDYFSSMGIPWEYPELVKANPRMGRTLEGLSFEGNIYVYASDGNTLVYSQDGDRIGVVKDPGVYPDLSDPNRLNGDVSPPFERVNQNGDVYFSYAVNHDKMYIYRASRSWGVDYVAIAKTGVTKADIEKNQPTLQGFSNVGLRILRNAFFALQGYDFQSWDLKTYFNGYDWYQPKPDMKADPATLNPDQKRLFDLVIAEEARRQ